jgi:hypothetical protein
VFLLEGKTQGKLKEFLINEQGNLQNQRIGASFGILKDFASQV